MKRIAILALALLALVPTAALAAAGKLATLYAFPGRGLNWSLTRDKHGNLYGIATAGAGYIYELKRSSHGFTEQTLYSFCALSSCLDGVAPTGALVIDTAGNLYGTTNYGGATGEGTAFELMHRKDGWSLKTLYDFCHDGTPHCADGSQPQLGLTFAGAQAGGLYDGTSPLLGIATEGGTPGDGLIFQIKPSTMRDSHWVEDSVYAFCDSSDAGCGRPYYGPQGIMVDGHGNIYGGTAGGGQNAGGVIFEIIPDASRTTWTATVLYDFCSLSNCADGGFAGGAPLLDDAGNLYGTTLQGGINATCCGVLYKLSSSGPGWTETLLHTFCAEGGHCPQGAIPRGRLITDSVGTLYGVTSDGGKSKDHRFRRPGVIYSFGSEYKVLSNFCRTEDCSDGGQPDDGLVLDGAGHLFGTTNLGGATGGGTVYELKR